MEKPFPYMLYQRATSSLNLSAFELYYYTLGDAYWSQGQNTNKAGQSLKYLEFGEWHNGHQNVLGKQGSGSRFIFVQQFRTRHLKHLFLGSLV